MISVILYGRNDSYGYNLHKRAALSLNCIAEVLTDPDDEILFVDYNTPDDYPTFPEAIEDTLTANARRRLRILRLRPAVHARYASLTHLVALEPISRNVAIRRSNPANRWILSTNTDLIFVPKVERSLSDITKDLPARYFHLPRFELPESMWETLDRLDPAGTIDRVREWGTAFHLNEVVYAEDRPAYRFDGPGDFQLVLRDDLFRINGFHERMLLGWHVDSNMAQRLSLLYGETGDLSADLAGYHCDHTRQVTPAHRPGRVQNDWRVFVDGVRDAAVCDQADDWGLPDAPIEELRLDGGGRYLAALKASLDDIPSRPMRLNYDSSAVDRIGYDAAHALPFLVDALVCYPRVLSFAWFGARPDLLTLLAQTFKELGFTRPILVPEELAAGLSLPDNVRSASQDEMIASADLIGFDFGFPPAEHEQGPSPARDTLMRNYYAFLDVANAEIRRRKEQLPPRRVVVVNVVHSRFDALVHEHLGAPAAPICTRMRQGFITSGAASNLMDHLVVFPAGKRTGEGVFTQPGISHAVFLTSRLALLPGEYEFRVSIEPRHIQFMPTFMELEALIADRHLARRRHYLLGPMNSKTLRLRFTVAADSYTFEPAGLGVEFRLTTRGQADCRISEATAVRVD